MLISKQKFIENLYFNSTDSSNRGEIGEIAFIRGAGLNALFYYEFYATNPPAIDGSNYLEGKHADPVGDGSTGGRWVRADIDDEAQLFPEWEASTSYVIGDRVQNSDGVVIKSLSDRTTAVQGAAQVHFQVDGNVLFEMHTADGSKTNYLGITFTDDDPRPVLFLPGTGFGANSDDVRGYLGAPNRRWRKGYVVDGIETGSDRRIKRNIEDLPEALLEVWFDHVKVKQYNLENDPDSDVKVGVIAQDIIAAFEAADLDWRNYDVVNESASKMEGDEEGLGKLGVMYDAVSMINSAAMQYKLKKAGIL